MKGEFEMAAVNNKAYTYQYYYYYVNRLELLLS